MKALSFIFCSPLCVKGIYHSHADQFQKDADPPAVNTGLCNHLSILKTTKDKEQGRVRPSFLGIVGTILNLLVIILVYCTCILLFETSLWYVWPNFPQGNIYFPDTEWKIKYCIAYSSVLYHRHLNITELCG